MGGERIDTACRSNMEGLFVAGEDASGVHGANRLGGNGVGCSTVFGGIAGDSLAAYISGQELPHAVSLATAQKGLERLREQAERVYVRGAPRLNAEWQEWLNLQSLLTV